MYVVSSIHLVLDFEIMSNSELHGNVKFIVTRFWRLPLSLCDVRQCWNPKGSHEGAMAWSCEEKLFIFLEPPGWLRCQDYEKSTKEICWPGAFWRGGVSQHFRNPVHCILSPTCWTWWYRNSGWPWWFSAWHCSNFSFMLQHSSFQE